MDVSGLASPPALGSSALAPGAYDGQSVIVTGGGTGLGRAIALEFARLGAAIAIFSRKQEHLDMGVHAVSELGGEAVGIPCDVRDPKALVAAFDAAKSSVGLPAILVNNAAGNFPSPAEDLSPNAFRTVVDIVLNGTFNCSREFARRHIAAKSGGVIINIGASYAWTGGPGFAHSAAAKAGVKNLTDTLAVEWAPYGIRVNGLVPGLFPHEDEVEAIQGVPGRSEREETRCPALRAGQPRELGWAATFLASPHASFITGNTLVVDGANWQRRAMLQPEFSPIREQLGKGPFEAD